MRFFTFTFLSDISNVFITFVFNSDISDVFITFIFLRLASMKVFPMVVKWEPQIQFSSIHRLNQVTIKEMKPLRYVMYGQMYIKGGLLGTLRQITFLFIRSFCFKRFNITKSILPFFDKAMLSQVILCLRRWPFLALLLVLSIITQRYTSEMVFISKHSSATPRVVFPNCIGSM